MGFFGRSAHDWDEVLKKARDSYEKSPFLVVVDREEPDYAIIDVRHVTAVTVDTEENACSVWIGGDFTELSVEESKTFLRKYSEYAAATAPTVKT